MSSIILYYDIRNESNFFFFYFVRFIFNIVLIFLHRVFKKMRKNCMPVNCCSISVMTSIDPKKKKEKVVFSPGFSIS